MKKPKSKRKREVITFSADECYEEELIYKLKIRGEKFRSFLDENDIFAEITLNPEKYLLLARLYS